MLPTLLSTKFYIPRIRSTLVPRRRLIECLNTSLRGKVTLLSAPAGFGKTTLVSEWVQHLGRPVAWLSLDKNDNDLTRFLTYLIAALQRIAEDIGIDIQAALGESQSPKYEILLTRLVNEIDAIPEKFILILDDYHLIEAETVNNALSFLIEHQPASMHLVISGRSDPLLPISRLRVRGELGEIRARDLRFTEEEAAIFLKNLMGIDLSPEDIAVLEEHTEGWAASLQLAALSMQGREDRREFIAAFSGSHRYVIDFLADEVMSRQPEDVQIFLRRTSILERFCAPLCDAVVKGELSGNTGIIDYLEHANLFLIPLDDQREWYRFHHLFSDFLRMQLQKVEPDSIPEFHRRASQWYEAKGLMDEAIQHALAGGDQESATRLVERIAGSLVVRRYSKSLLNWVNQLSPETTQNFPMLCIWHAWATFFLGQSDAVEPILEIAEANRGKAPDIPIRGYTTTVRAYLANLMGDFRQAIKLSRQALEQLSEAPSTKDTLIFQGAALIWLGVNHRILGDIDTARDLFTEAVKLNEDAGSIYAALSAVAQSANIAVIQGRLHKAEEIYQEGFQIVKRWLNEQGEEQSSLVAAGELHLGLGKLLYQWNDLPGAAPLIRRSVDLFELGGDQGRIDGYEILAYLNQAESDYEAAYKLLGIISSIKDEFPVRRINSSPEPGFEQLCILLSQVRPEMSHLLTDVAHRVEIMGLRSDDEIDFSSTGYAHEYKYSDLSRALIALDRASEALPLLERLTDGARSMGRVGDEIRYLVLKAMAHHSLENIPSALDYLSRALVLAEPQGYVRLFVDEGPPMAHLLYEALSHGIAPDYVQRLLAAFLQIETEPSIPPGPQFPDGDWIEPLTERELDVLKLIAEGLINQEIGDKLFLSLNTIKAHTRSIYGKLGVNNRTQAVSKARSLGIISGS